VRIGFYKRKTVVVDNKIYENVPIARWLCHQQGTRKSKHKTFSLLPYPLIPYHRHGLNVTVDTVNFHHQNGTTFKQTKSFISSNGVDTDIPLENKHIHNFNKTFSQALLKLTSVAELNSKSARPAIGTAAIPSRPCSSLSMVNHRKFANVVQFFYEWIAREFDFAPRPESTFFLASAIRIVDAKQMKLFIPDPEPF
jgi:hypothetical protein